MKCPRCAYFNLPGSDVCGRCGTSLNEPVSSRTAPVPFDDIYPPRARSRSTAVRIGEPLRRAARRTQATAVLQRVRAAALAAASAASGGRTTVEKIDWRPGLLASCAVIPGLIQAWQGRGRKAALLVGAMLVLIAGIVATIHWPLSSMLLWALLALSLYSVWEVADYTFPFQNPTDPRDTAEAAHLRTVRLALLAVGIVAVTAACAFQIAGRWYRFSTIRSDQAAPLLRAGDGIMVRRFDPNHDSHSLHRGDVIQYFLSPSADLGAEFRGASGQIERILGLPGDQLELRPATEGAILLVNNRPITGDHRPLTPLPLQAPGRPIHITIPAGFVGIWRNIIVTGLYERELDPNNTFLIVPTDDIEGRAIAIYGPAARRRWLR